MKSHGQVILTPYISLDTPGKATVQVVILADPVSISLVLNKVTSICKYLLYSIKLIEALV